MCPSLWSYESNISFHWTTSDIPNKGTIIHRYPLRTFTMWSGGLEQLVERNDLLLKDGNILGWFGRKSTRFPFSVQYLIAVLTAWIPAWLIMDKQISFRAKLQYSEFLIIETTVAISSFYSASDWINQ